MSGSEGVMSWSLPQGDPRVAQALSSGWLETTKGERTRAVARGLVRPGSPGAAPEVLFEALPAVERPAGVAPWLLAVRAYSLTATVTPCLAVALLLLVQGAQASWGMAALAIVGVCLLQMSINLFNDIEDYRKLIDLPGTLGGSGVIQKGWWSPAELRRLAWGALFLGAAAGLPSVIASSGSLYWISLLAGLGVLGYSARRFGLKYNALGDVAVFILCGPALTTGFAIAATRGATVSPGVLWVGAWFGLLAMALLHINNVQDMHLDRSRGVRTLALILGFQGSLVFNVLLHLAAPASLVAGVWLGHLPTAALLGVLVHAAVAGPWVLRVSRALGPESALLSRCRIRAAQIHLLGGLGLCVGLLIARAIT